jgi:hypothetical protein
MKTKMSAKKKAQMMTRGNGRPSGLDGGASITAEYFAEPLLEFAGGRHHVDPKSGISRFGPKSFQPALRHPATVRVGFIGTAETIEKAHNWIESASERVPGDIERPEFPGFRADRGFFCSLETSGDWNVTLTASELAEIKALDHKRTRFEAALEAVESKLSILATKDRAPEYVVLALPDELLEICEKVEYVDAMRGKVRRDLRRALKSLAMKYRMPTQLVREKTSDGKSDDYPSEIAWDFFTALYYKAGGLPWGPVGLAPGSCYIGISFFRPLDEDDSLVQTSLVQAFDEHGDGLVLRGQDFRWDPARERSHSPHLSGDHAEWLMNMALDRYKLEMGQAPQRVVIHKTSRFLKDELGGFETALRSRVTKYDLLALTPDSTVRLFPVNQYPPLRGTRFSVGEWDYLYTNGFSADLQQFHGNHVPSPLRLAEHFGRDTPRSVLLQEILILSKMNWNSSRMGGLLPVNLNFARRVGEILKEIPKDREPLTNFKFYI